MFALVMLMVDKNHILVYHVFMMDKFPQSKGEFDNSNERFKLCQRLAPRIIRATEEFYDPEKPHPFLDTLAGGGYITSHPEQDTVDTEYLTIIEAAGFRDTLNPESFEAIGIPEEVAASGQMWVVSKREAEFEKDRNINPTQRRSEKVSHCFAYWDGSDWLVKRLKKDAAESDPWEEKWEDTNLTEEEEAAISIVATQTQDVQSIAETFDGDRHAFKQTFLDVLEQDYGATDESKRRFGDYAVGTPFPYGHMPMYSLCFKTAYQAGNLLDTAYKLSRGNSRNLDSSGIINARYYTQSMPFTSEMAENGVEIPQRNIHPPVPVGFVKK